MFRKFILSTLILSGIYTNYVSAQDKETTVVKAFTQKVRGRVLDAESNQPLAGVVVITKSNNQLNGMTDGDGYYTIQNVPIGRQSFLFQYAGYEPATIHEVMVTSGKELELNISLTERLHQLDEVTITATNKDGKAENEFATISARSISVEETKRYAAAFSDPARMAQNFMGVSNGGDMFNGIIVRGNSPKNVLWRLEGIEIPNPNHFSSLGTTGGAISMLNANVLGVSDFYTGAFPAEMGNALSGVFDMKFRNGNTEKHEHTFQLSALGTELASEGPFKKGGRSSYLFNYRYSTLALLDNIVSFGGVLPKYQDASLKLNFPTEKAGTFSVWALGGYNSAYKDPDKDSTLWTDDNPNFVLKGDNMMGVAGINHVYFTGKNSYIKTIISSSYESNKELVDTLNPTQDYRPIHVSDESFINNTYKLSILYNTKLNSKNTVRFGAIAQQLAYRLDNNFYDESQDVWKSVLKGDGSTQFYQAYAQWKHRMSEHMTLTGGVHGSYYALNGKYSIEPRVAAVYTSGKNTWSVATGLHSKPEHISTYLFQNNQQGQAATYPNKNLDLLKAYHAIAGYERLLPLKMRFKTEVYYQYLYDIPVEKNSNSGFSIINAMDIYSLYNTNQLVSTGTGQNYGIDMSIERPFADNYYLLATASLFKSTYTDYYGDVYNTTFNRGYQLNIVGGKEFVVDRKGRKILGLNGKVLYSGGMRQSPIDISTSRQTGETVYIPKQYFTDQVPAYYRFDLGVYYKINRKRVTHSIQLDIQNVTNRANFYYSYYDNKAGAVKTVNQLGIFPNIAYRIDF
ncbi:MAG: TonB-dependent receptor [Chitinophagales bacterium]|nr:TonB-dependent receptor [Chitinophagales bacterium]